MEEGSTLALRFLNPQRLLSIRRGRRKPLLDMSVGGNNNNNEIWVRQRVRCSDAPRRLDHHLSIASPHCRFLPVVVVFIVLALSFPGPASPLSWRPPQPLDELYSAVEAAAAAAASRSSLADVLRVSVEELRPRTHEGRSIRLVSLRR